LANLFGGFEQLALDVIVSCWFTQNSLKTC
jgi:hypothetical protein